LQKVDFNFRIFYKIKIMNRIKEVKPKQVAPGVTGHYVPHSAVAATDCVVIDAFSPVREGYKNLESAAFSYERENGL